MTVSMVVAQMERRRHRLERIARNVPYATLAGSLCLYLLSEAFDLVSQRPAQVTIPVTVLAGGWLWLFLTAHPEWEDRRGLMAVFFAGLLVFIGVLIWCSPLYAFFGWCGYLVSPYALAGRWRLAGTCGVALLNAVAQVGGFPSLTGLDGWLAYALLFVLNAVLASGMTYLAMSNEEQALQRAQMIDELAQANDKLAGALRENAGLHAQLLVQAREAGVLDERQRMAGEIHDVLAQGLTGIVTQLEAADVATGRPADHQRHLAAAKRLARESLTEARRSVRALRPGRLDDAALPDAIGEVVRGWSALHGVAAELITTGTPRPLLPQIETTLLRTAEEALANVAKHAAARRVGLTLSYMEDLVTLDVRDYGAGFDPAAPPDAAYEGGFGLNAMRERVRRVAGTLEVESEPGGGTAISACVPAIAIGAAA
jgi:signal transduction histidine kinase